MELLHIWIEKYKNIKEQGFNFSLKRRFQDGPTTCKLGLMKVLHVFILIVWPLAIWCQPSFQVKMEIDDGGIGTVMANQNNEIAIQLIRPNVFDKRNILTRVPGLAGSIQGFKYMDAVVKWFYVGQSDFVDDRVYLSHFAGQLPSFNSPSRSNFMSMDINTGAYWCKRILPQYQFGFAGFKVDVNSDVYILNGAISSESSMPNFYPEKGMVELYKLDGNGNTIWKNGFLFLEEAQGDTFTVHTRGIEVGAANQLFITGGLTKGNIGSFITTSHFIAKLDAMGNPLVWKIINGYFPNNMVVTDEGVYLLDKYYYSPTTSDWGIEDFALIVKLDHDLNLLWAKKYYADNFPYTNANLIKSEDGRLLFTSVTIGAFPAILAEIDHDGNIIQQKGYPYNRPQTKLLNDGSLVMASEYGIDNMGNLFPAPIIAKTDSDGNMAGCTTLSACLIASDTTVEMGNFLIEPHPVLDLEDVVLEVEPFTSTFTTSLCSDYPPAPVSTFTFPDSLCVGETATSVSDGNRLAQVREWHLTGPGTDSVLQEDILFPFDKAFEFAYQFTEPGGYLLRQSVWVLGCRYDYERTVTVLPPLSVSILADSLLCPDEPQEIAAAANRTASYAWSTSQTGPTLTVTASGTYAVTATDGGCTATNSASVTVVAGLLNGQPAFTLPFDTTLCDRELPFMLVPQSGFVSAFTLGNDPTPAASFELPAAGTYKIGMEAFGCEFEKTFRLVVGCHADVYVPNSFSPNGDGINDVFQPFGSDFEVLELSIFDRWGGQMHKGVDWDGGKAGQGVYLYKLTYLDLLTEKRLEVNGEVTLVK